VLYLPSRLLALFGVFLLAASAHGQGLYRWSNLAGATGGPGYADGPALEARFSRPSSTAVDGNGNVYVADQLNSTIRKISSAGVVTTLAGASGQMGTDDGVGSAARFSKPGGVAVDGSGNVYVADMLNNRIRKIAGAGVVSTLADSMGTVLFLSGPRGVAVDASGNVYVSESYTHRIRKITTAGVLSTLAGDGTPGSADGTGTAAQFNEPVGLAVDGGGNVYVADRENHTIRKITSAGEVSTLAGSAGTMGFDNGTGSAARFWYPTGVTVDGSGTLFVTHATGIRKITSDGVVTTFAGSLNSTGAGNGTGSEASFDSPAGLSVDGAGNLFVAEPYWHSIRKVTSATVVTTFAGTLATYGMEGKMDGEGSAAQFSLPFGIAIDGSGNAYVADTFNGLIRKITRAGVVTTVAGNGTTSGAADGFGTAAQFSYPSSVAVDAAGALYVADTSNHTIRKIVGGVVSTFAGLAGNSGSEDGTGSAARFNLPNGVAVDSSGNLYVSDSGNYTIRKITSDGVVSTLAGGVGESGNVDAAGTAARFASPFGVAVDAGGTVYVADPINRAVRKITSDGSVSTLTSFGTPIAVAVDGDGTVFAVDQDTTILKLMSAGFFSVIGGRENVPGNEPGLGRAARFNDARGIAVGPDGWLYVAGGYNSNVLRGLPSPVLIVEEPAGAARANGSTVDWDALLVGSASARTFTVRNSGADEVYNLAVTIDGVPSGNATGDFVVTTPLGSGSLAAGASTTVTVTFTPSAMGPRSATLHVASNDFPFAVTLRGSGADPAAPDAIISTGPGAFTNSTSAQFSFTTAGGGAGVSFEGKLDDGNYAPVTNPVSLSGLAAGAHTYSVRALSPAGYPGLNFTTRSWTIDLVPPVITFVPPDAVIPTDTLDGENFLFLAATAADNLGPPAITYSKVGSLYPVGTTVVIVTATDIAGNTATASFKVTVRLNHLIHTPLLAQGARVPGHGTVAGPPEDGKLTSFGVPAIDEDGTVAFLAKWIVAGPLKSQGSGIFTPTICVAQIGGVAGPFGVTFKTLGDPVIGGGRLAFLATLAGVPMTKAGTVWSGLPASPALVAQQGDIAPDASGAKPSGGATFKTFKAVAVEGESVAIFAQLTGGTGALKATAANDYGLWIKDATHPLTLVLREGQVAGTRTIGTLTTFAVGAGSPGQGRGWLTQTAFGPRVLALASFTGTDKAQAVLGVGFGGGVGVLAQNNPNSTLPDIAGASFASYGLPAINPDGKSAFLASLLVKPGGPATVANARGIFVDYGNPTYTKIARLTEPAPATGTSFSLLKDPVLAEDNGIAFPATLKATPAVRGFATTTLWWKTNYGPLQLLAQGGPRPAGQPIPGLPIEAQWTTFPSLAIAADRGPLFTATLLAGKGGVTAATANGVWATDYAGVTQLLFRTGIPDAILAGKTLKSFTLLKTAVGSIGVTRSFNNVGQLVWLATFTDSTTALITTDIP
jgi:sugar lactone lactonase YvrE